MKPVYFERAIFLGWYCSKRDCSFCYMSTIKHREKIVQKFARRTTESILAEVILCRILGWNLGFISGGHNLYKTEDFKELLNKINIVSGKRLWVNIGALTKEELIEFKPYIKGVVGSIETINSKIHSIACPSKPIEPFEKMFDEARKLKIKSAMTIILGLGETINDFELLKEFIKKNHIMKIHFYGLNPQKNTVFENARPPTAEYQAEWIKKTRKEFPNMDIQCGIWLDRAEYISTLLNSGADSISKFPAIKKFGSREAKIIEDQAKKAGRNFKGTLTTLPNTNKYKKEKL